MYDDAGNQIAVVDARGNRTTSVYDALNRAYVTVDAANQRTTMNFDAAGRVESVVDARNNRTTYLYDGDGRQTGVVNALNERTTTGYDAAGNVFTVDDGRGNRTTYLYDDANRRTGTVDALNGRETVAYDALGNVINTYDALNNRTTYVYDDLNRRTEGIDALSGRETTVYDAASQVTAVVDQLGNRTSFLYDADGRQTVTIDALGNRTTSTFDAAGNVTERTDALGNTWKTTYDALGRPVRQEDPLSPTNATTTVYDAVGNVTVSIDARGNRTTSTYDAVNRRTVVQDAVGGLTTTGYDAVGNAVTVTNARNYTTTIAYDALNRTSAVTDALSHTTTTIYDAAGNVQVTVDAESNRTTYGYDALNRQVTMTKPSGGVWTTVYDAASNVVNMIDPLSNMDTYVYDALNRQTKHIDANGGTTTYLYDAASNRTGIIDASNNRSTFVYDALNRESVQIDALGKRTTATYDAVGHVTSIEDALGRRRNSFYGAAGQKVMERWTNPDTVDSNLLAYSYDANENVLTAGDNNGTYTFSYDALNRKTVQQGPYGVTMTATYDAVGNRTVLQDSLGGLQTATYNAVDQVETLKYTDSNGTVRADYTYTARNQVQTITRYSNLAATVTVGKTSYVYDTTGRVQNIHHYDGSLNNLGNWTYAYDAADRITTITEDSTAKTYSYDSTSQLTSDNGTTYGYDATGNRNTTGYTVGTGNRITNDGTWTYTYDAVGNLVKKSKGASAETWTYGYDHRNQLIWTEKRATDGGTLQQRVDYANDVFGNLISEVVTVSGASTKRHVYWIMDPYDIGFSKALHERIAELDGSSTLVIHYVSPSGDVTPLARLKASGSGWLLTDHLGGVRIVTDTAGASVKVIVYDAWGNIASEIGAGDKGSLLFAGYYKDAVTGEYIAKWRRLNLNTGQWTTADPIGFAAGDVNTSRYVGNSPLLTTDWSGLEWRVKRNSKNELAEVSSSKPDTDTFAMLAKDIGMDVQEIRYWMKVGAFQVKLPKEFDTNLKRIEFEEDAKDLPISKFGKYSKFFVPNVVVAYWGGNIGRLGRLAVGWKKDIQALQKKGYHVIEKGLAESMTARELGNEIKTLARSSMLYGVYFWGHGNKDHIMLDAEAVTSSSSIMIAAKIRRDPWLHEVALSYLKPYYYTFKQLQKDSIYHLGIGIYFSCLSDSPDAKATVTPGDGLFYGVRGELLPFWIAGGGIIGEIRLMDFATFNPKSVQEILDTRKDLK